MKLAVFRSSAFRSPVFARCLPFAVFIVALAARGAIDGHADTRWLYPLQAGAGALALAFLWRHYSELRADRRAVARPTHWLMSLGAGMVVFLLWITLTEPWMRVGEPVAAFIPVDADDSLQWGLIALRGMGAVLVVPLIEELFWRSFLMRWIDQRDFLNHPPQQTSLYALLVSSAVFALGHDLWLAGLIAGLAFGALYRYTGRIWHAVAAHAVANLALAVWVVHQRAWGFW